MNRSVTIVLCAAVVWAAGLGDATEAGLQRQKRRQTEISSSTRPAIPEIVGDYVLIYKPQPDVYTGKDTKHYRAGQRYTNWQPNDHTFIKGPDNRWHCFGITRPNDVAGDGVHEGEGLCFHAVSATRHQSRPTGVEVISGEHLTNPCLTLGFRPAESCRVSERFQQNQTRKTRSRSADLYQ